MIRNWKYLLLLVLLVGCSKTDEQALRPVVSDRALQFTAHLISESEWGAAYAAKSDSTKSDVSLSRAAFEPQMVCDTLTTADTLTVVTTVEPWFGELSDSTAIDSIATDYRGYEPPITRGTPIVNVKGLTQLRINLYNTGTNNFDIAAPPAKPTQVINATGSNGVFSYSPPYNWMNSTDKLTMFTYAPHPSSTNGIVETTPPLKLTYTVPTDVTKQPDLCMAPAVLSQDNQTGNQHLRSVPMYHMLTAVGFAIKGYKVTISKVELVGVASSGTLDLTKTDLTKTDLTTAAWTPDNGTATFATTVNKPSLNDNHNSAFHDITTTTGWLMMVPQDFTNNTGAKISITFSENGGAAQTKTVYIKDTGAAKWEAGKKVIYNIRMRTAPVVTSTALTILDYRAGYTTSAPMALAAGIASDDNLTFSWSNSTFKVHRGNAATGIQPTGGTSPWTAGPASTSSNYTTPIWFFTTSKNETANSRSVDVSIEGKKSAKQIVTVTQNPLKFTLTAPGTLGAAANSTQSAKYTINSGLGTGSQDVPLVWTYVPSWLDKASLPTALKAGGGTITYKASQANSDTKERQQEMTATADGFCVAKVMVKQAANPVSIKTDITTWYNASGYGDSKPVKVTTTNATGWTVTVTGEMRAYPTSGKSGETCTLVYTGLEGIGNTRYASATFSTANPTGAETTVETSQKGAEYNAVNVGGILWANGFLVAHGNNGCKIGSNLDPGLYFQFGSLAGWSGGTNGDGTGWGTPSSVTLRVKPYGYSGSLTYPGAYVTSGNVPATDNSSTGIGDPCRYYLGSPWRLPTKAEYQSLINTGFDLAKNGDLEGVWFNNKTLFFTKSGLIYRGKYTNIGGELYSLSSEEDGKDGWGNRTAHVLFADYSFVRTRGFAVQEGQSVRCMHLPNEQPPLQLSATSVDIACVMTSTRQITYTPSYISPTVSSNQAWCGVSINKLGTITITAKEANMNKTSTRQATVTVKSNNVTKTFTVTQAKNTFGTGFTLNTENVDIDKTAFLNGALSVSGTPVIPSVSNSTNSVCSPISITLRNEAKGEWQIIYLHSGAPLYTIGTGTVSCNGATKTINYFVAK